MVPFPSLSAAAPLKALRLLMIGGVVVLALSACGRKGPLEPPPGAVSASDNPLEEQEDDATAPAKVIPSVSPVGSRKGKPIKAPKEKFFLDPIL